MLRRQLILSQSFHIVLLLVLYLMAVYFFIGINLSYLSQTQNQINAEAVYLITDLKEKTENNITAADLSEVSKRYNLGVAYSDNSGNRAAYSLNTDELILRLEFGGRLISREVTLEGDKGQVVLTFFRPWLSGDDTVKFLPAFFRLSSVFTIFTLIFSAIVSMINASLFKKDVKRVDSFVSHLVKGSLHDFGEKADYMEFQAVLDKMQILRTVIMKQAHQKKRMTADFAHELRTPLTTLQTHLEALIDGVWEPSTERFISCHDEILRLIRLVGDLEKLSKVEDENIILNKSPFDLNELIRQISLNFQGELSQNSISLTIYGDKEEISADRDKISQVIVNLLSNSLKYATRNGRILVHLKGDTDHVYLIINDNGIGIPTKDLPNVFDRLYRSDTSRARATGGAGIGLTIARSIIEAHCGSIDIVSQEGLGTEVTVIIPRI